METSQPTRTEVLDSSQARALVAALSSGAGPDLPLLETLLADYRIARAVLDGSCAGIAIVDRDLRYLYINDALAQINGVPPARHLGRRIDDIVPGPIYEPMHATLQAVLGDGVARTITLPGRTTAAGAPTEPRWWANSFHRLEDAAGAILGLVGVIVEVTEAHRVREALAGARSRLALLDEAATRTGTTLDVNRACKELTRLFVPRLADMALVDVLDAKGGADPLAHGPMRLRRISFTTVPRLAKAVKLGAVGSVSTPPMTAAVARCLTEQRPIVVNLPSPQQAAALAARADRMDTYRGLSLHSAIFVPLSVRRELVGAVTLVRAGDSPPFSDQDVDLVADLCRRAATGISNAKRFAREHENALILQQALIYKPKAPHPDLRVASRYLPAGRGTEIGGDWYDTVALPGGKSLLVVGDVMGHGFEAAATMSEYRAVLRTLAMQSERPREILREAQRVTEGLGFERVATCLVAAVDPGARTCEFANAGHMPPLLVHPERGSELVEVPIDPPLGVGPRDFEQATVAFGPGDVLLLYTDGLVERRGTDIEESLARLRGLDLDPGRPLERLLDAALAGMDAGESEDDVALLAARLAPVPGARPGRPAPRRPSR